MDQFLSKYLLAVEICPFSKSFLIDVEDIIFFFFFKGDGFIILYLNFFSKNFNNFTSPSRLFPNLKLLLTKINFADNFL